MGSGVRPSHYKLSIGDKIIDEKRNLIVLNRRMEIRQQKALGCVTGYTNRTKKFYTLRCNVCNAEFDMEENNLLSRQDNCPCCANKRVFPGINDIATVRPDLITYFDNPEDATKYVSKSQKYAMCRCPDCGYKKKISIGFLTTYGFSCSNCSDGISYPNKFSYALLKQLPVTNVQHEYIIPEYPMYRYDNYFEYQGQQFLLEMDGLQHFQDVAYFSDRNDTEIDHKKNEAANELNYKLIRIDCSRSNQEYICDHIKKSELATIFDLSSIDWVLCDSFASKSVYIQTIKLYKQNYQAEQISQELNISVKSVEKYIYKAKCNKLINEDTYTELQQKAKNELIEQIQQLKAANPSYDYVDLANCLHESACKIKRIIIQAVANNQLVYNNLQEEIDKRKRNSLNNLTNGSQKKEVYMYDSEMNYCGKYNSGIEICNVYPDLNFTVKGIQKVCVGYQKSHRNYYFSYIPLTA